MSDDARDMPGGVVALLALLTAGWLLGTPVLGYGAVVMSAAFLGQAPSAEESAMAARLLVGALLCGLGAPLLAALLALRHGRRGLGGAFLAAAALTGAVLALLAAA